MAYKIKKKIAENGETESLLLSPDAIEGLADIATSGSYADLSNKPTIPTYDTVTTTTEGLMSSEDKTKLDGIAVNANNYVLPSDVVVDSDLADVATSGSYDDLNDKPTMPTIIREND